MVTANEVEGLGQGILGPDCPIYSSAPTCHRRRRRASAAGWAGPPLGPPVPPVRLDNVGVQRRGRAGRPLRFSARAVTRETGRCGALLGRSRLTSGYRSGCSMESTAKSTSISAQYKWCAEGLATLRIWPTVASRNHGNFEKDTKSSRSSSRSQKPFAETLVTSALEMFLPRGADLIFVLPSQTEGLRTTPRAQTVVGSQFDLWLEPELRLAFGGLNVDVRPRLLPREEVEPKPLDPKNCRAHSKRLSRGAPPSAGRSRSRQTALRQWGLPLASIVNRPKRARDCFSRSSQTFFTELSLRRSRVRAPSAPPVLVGHRLRLQEIKKLFDRQVGRRENGGKSARVDRPMSRDHDLGERSITAVDEVTATLSFEVEAGLLERATHLPVAEASRKMPQRTATSTSTVSRPTSVGTGRPSSSRASMYACIASRRFFKTCGLVLPWETHPRRAGQYATNPDSRPFSTRTV